MLNEAPALHPYHYIVLFILKSSLNSQITNTKGNALLLVFLLEFQSIVTWQPALISLFNVEGASVLVLREVL